MFLKKKLSSALIFQPLKILALAAFLSFVLKRQVVVDYDFSDLINPDLGMFLTLFSFCNYHLSRASWSLHYRH